MLSSRVALASNAIVVIAMLGIAGVLLAALVVGISQPAGDFLGPLLIVFTVIFFGALIVVLGALAYVTARWAAAVRSGGGRRQLLFLDLGVAVISGSLLTVMQASFPDTGYMPMLRSLTAAVFIGSALGTTGLWLASRSPARDIQ